MSVYDFKKIEKKWSLRWLKDKIYEPDLSSSRRNAKKTFYNLMMFPYPSAEGLHVGNMYAFVGADIYGRKKRMEGFDVFEPIGLDGFGIHSENYALKSGKHPKKQAIISEKNFYSQMKMIGNGFAWDEKLETYDPDYYKWTQWIFVNMFKNGLAVRRKAKVNWCPECLTVLADEQVLAGECERCSENVIQKELEQWFFKITDYAERLLNDLEKIDWSERVKIAQKNWIGKSEGALINFSLLKSDFNIEVFTTRPDTIYGATYIVLSPEHALIINDQLPIINKKDVEEYVKKAKEKTEEERIAENKEKTGIELKGIMAINPATKEEIPIWIADYVLAGYGTGAIMAVPAHDERDLEFAKKFDLPIRDASLVDKDEAIKKVGGNKTINYHLRDWLISRQRYWGPPIPMIYCPSCAKALEGKENAGWQAVPEEELPVLLPDVKNFRPTGTDKSPLDTVEKFVKTKCPECGGEAKRETDVSDTFLDSAWYYLRYPSIDEQKKPWNSKITKSWLPVDMYIGGAEHSVLHLLYTRFLTKAFHDWGLVDFDEPFEKFRAHGLLIKDGAKMSKSKGNVVNPDEYIKKFGADVLRTYLMFLGPFDRGGDFRDESIAGIVRFLNRVCKLGSLFSGIMKNNQKQITKNKKPKTEFEDTELETVLHKSIKKVGEDIENLHYNTAISQLMILFNAIEKGATLSVSNFTVFLKLLSPFAPFISEEFWNELGESGSIHKSKWPEYDEKKIKEKTKTVIVQINGKMRDKFEMPADAGEDELKTRVLELPKIKEAVGGKSPLKMIVIRNRLVNIVKKN